MHFVYVGPAKCALSISSIQEILKIDRPNEPALGFGNCVGTLDLRGSTVPIIDLAALLRYREIDRSETATQGDRRIIVIRLEKEFFGLMVDSVDSIVSYFQDELLLFPIVEQDRMDMLAGCITGHGETDLLLLNHDYLLNSEAISEVTRGHSSLFESQETSDQKLLSKGGARRSFTTVWFGCGCNRVHYLFFR